MILAAPGVFRSRGKIILSSTNGLILGGYLKAELARFSICFCALEK